MSFSALDPRPSVLVAEDKSASFQHAISSISDLSLITLLTPVVLLIHGYHPFADDAGIYVAGIRKMIDPRLFTVDADFVVAHTRLSVFSHIFAAALRLFHIPLELALIAAYLFSVFVFLLGCMHLARQFFADSPQLQWGAVLFSGALFTLPVAATSLWIMDPYVTARSFSTPFSLFAIAACMDRAWARTAMWLLLAAVMHPLMAAYLAVFLLAYILSSGKHWRGLSAACAGAFLASSAVYLATHNSLLTDGYKEAALSRGYFFLSTWHWYELLGLAFPLFLMAVAVICSISPAVRDICLACIVTGLMACLVSACFVHTNGSFFLARIQPLRTFQLIYITGTVMLGGFCANYFRGRRAIFGCILLALVSAAMLLVQKKVYQTSAHVEWPFSAPHNSWQQAFLWIRHNTPQDAVFALDSNYTKIGAEDTQGFRATAVRSALVDELKDGGVAAIFPAIAPRWKAQRDLEVGLDRTSDQQRLARLKPVGVTWILLSSDAKTQFDCPYHNSTVMVCRMP